MFNVDKILVPTDFSEHSDFAFKRALDLAGACDAKIYLTYVAPDAPDVFKLSRYAKEGREKIQKESEKKCEEFFKSQIAKYPEAEKMEIETKVFTGSPYKEILDFQKKIKADMIVIGTHGDSPFEGFFFGSTSHKIVRHATCSVLIVRKPKYG
jgi:nucleotide-binding universal stress UspA family protein